MPRRVQRVDPASTQRFRDLIASIETELGIRTVFPDEVLAEAAESAAAPVLPDRDSTDLPFVTIDPPGATDLDQAVFIERSGRGYTVYYAIADVGAFVRPGGAVDNEAHLRGQTMYAPAHRVPLHPPSISEDAASLLPDQERPALVWQIAVDETGEGIDVEVFRSRVRSRGQYTYAEVQGMLDSGTADEVFDLLREVGRLRQERERERGGVSLPLPSQEITVADGKWSLAYRETLPVEEWNAQISLLTGMAAAHMMMYAEVGFLRTLPDADPRSLARIRRTADGLGIEWPQDMDYPDFVRSLDSSVGAHAAMLDECTSVLRGAGYVGFEGGVPEQPGHSAIASTYAHATAPIRRLGDRYVGEICVAICADEPVPEWVRSELTALPKTMQQSERLARSYEREILNLVEAGLLAGSVGSVFDGVIVDTNDKDAHQGTVVVRDPSVEAPVSGPEALPLGEQVRVRLVEADLEQRRVRFEIAE